MEEIVKILKSVTFEYGVIELRSDDILTYKPTKGIKTFSLPLVEAAVEVFLQVTEGNPKLYFCDISDFSENTDHQTKHYIKKTLPLYATACAVKEKSAVIAFATHLFLHFHKPSIPFRLFKETEHAITWLKEQ